MLIGIDGNEANVKNRVGSNVFAYEVINNLYLLKVKNSKIPTSSVSRRTTLGASKNNYIIYLRDIPLTDLPKETNWWKYKIVRPKRFWTQIGLPVALYTQKEKLEVFFTPGHYAPRFCPVPLVISILDTSYITFPNYFKKTDLYQLKNWSSYSIKKAKKIITISENSKEDIIKFYHRKSEDIIVVYPGYDREKFNVRIKNYELRIKEIKSKYHIYGEYVIYVGTLQPRKNLVRLIEAFKKLKTSAYVKTSADKQNFKLVIVGKKGWLYEEIFTKVKELNLEKEIIFTGFVEDNDLPYLIAGAKLYVLPSLYEGFGIPVVEAMAIGVPVIISKVSSLPEVGGKAAIYIENPESVENITNTLVKAINLKEGQRNEIIKRGLEQVKKFNWFKTAREILNVLENIR